MRYRPLYSLLALTAVAAAVAWPQIVIDPNPARISGHPASTPPEQISQITYAPNLVEGRELYAPMSVAVDTSGSSPILYVADSGNNRVLAWKNATSKTLTNLQKPDKVIGQPNLYTTLNGTNSSAGNSALTTPTGVFIDPQGNLYVADAGNNRILRYPAPFNANSNASPDLVLGQPDPYTSNRANQGGLPSPTTLSLSNTSYLTTAMAMDSNGNLYVTDAGNRRVLRYPHAALTANNFGPAADMVIGQGDFTTVSLPQGPTDRNHFTTPAGLAFDSAGHLFVSDAGSNRILVFAPPFVSGMASIRLAGIVSPTPATPTQKTFSSPEGIVMINDAPAIMDTGNNRILLFDAFSSPDWATSDTTFANPPPVAVNLIGQADYASKFANAGNAQPSAATFDSPVAAVVAGTDLFVADASNNRVLVFPNAPQMAGAGPNLSATQVLGQSGFPYNSINYIEGKEFLFGPNLLSTATGGLAYFWDAGIAVDTSANPPHLYVSDPGNNRVLGFADARKIGPGVVADLVIGQPDKATAVCNYGGLRVTSSGQPSNQPTQSSLCYPTGLAVDPSGNLYVADSLNGRVLRFPAPFQNCPGSGCAGAQADLVLGQSGFTGVKNPQPSQTVMAFPYGLVYDATNGLLVSDRNANRVLLFSKDSLTNGAAAAKVIGQLDFTSIASGSSTMTQPCHIAEDSNARVYVADSGNNRVLIFNSLPFLSTATSTTVAVNTLTSLNRPQAVWVNPTSVAGYPDDIWVGDSANGVLRFPRFALLGAAGTNQPSGRIPSAVVGATNCAQPGFPACFPTLAITQDGSGNLYVADYSNRVAVHYQAVAATNGASFICAGGCNLGGLNDTQYYLAPGAVGSVFGFSSSQFGQNADFGGLLPIPTTVGGIQVLLNGQPSPIFHVAPNQINFVVPTSAPTSGSAQLQVVEQSSGQVLGSGSVQMNTVAPAMFTSNQSGIGQIAALNQDNTVNSASNPAARGSYIQLFGTGQGLVPGMPSDGHLPDGLITTPSTPQVFIGGFQVPNSAIQFSGLAPCCVGLWQVNVQIPQTTAPGSQVSLVVFYQNYKSFNDPQHITTIAVK
jgi:uncharacterized protein (TIGR03437 family)